MLEVYWKDLEAKGYTDLISLYWFVQNNNLPDVEHSVVGPRHGEYLARCSVEVIGKDVLLDYGGVHKDHNRQAGMDIGVMKISFTDDTRCYPAGVHWRGESDRAFEEAPVAITLWEVSDSDMDELTAVEGDVRLVQHLRRERDPRLRAGKIRQALESGVLRCEACSLDFEAVYGNLGTNACEVHHRIALAITGQRKVELSDLAILCASCHRAIHRTGLDVADFAKQHVSAGFRRMNSSRPAAR